MYIDFLMTNDKLVAQNKDWAAMHCAMMTGKQYNVVDHRDSLLTLPSYRVWLSAPPHLSFWIQAVPFYFLVVALILG